MEFEDISYSRETTIAAVADFYTFLTKMYLDESQVAYPPAGGWPEIVNADPAVLRSFGKSDEVLALLARLPYIQYPSGLWDHAAEPTPGHVFINWPDLLSIRDPNDEDPGRTLRLYTEGDFYDIYPPHRASYVFLLDTKLGIIHWGNCSTRIENGEWTVNMIDKIDVEEEAQERSEEEADWRSSAPAWAIQDFFEVLKDQFRKLHWVPISHYSVRNVAEGEYHGEDGMMAMLLDIYRRHGWPDLTVYRKEDCIVNVLKAMKEKYPGSTCYREG
ncbi:uncharacterized protein B0T15DRAFT_569234 [Chaetomium strumarium]|uniref:Uncharacterized protein n=1 Tax=Chaetomium strumarium TaxID=1170767 RepID=A0AAJ0GPI7_9PEZI|nr:hypothetical protein B0T15DRAFT_569234 [Chaetomium strumarium]